MLTEQRQGLCNSCRELKEIAYIDVVGRDFCDDCIPMSVHTPERMLAYLMATIPFQVGDRVECRTAGVLFDGVGVIDEVSIDPRKFGTPVYPSFHVVIDQPAYPEAPASRWYMEAQLMKVAEEMDEE